MPLVGSVAEPVSYHFFRSYAHNRRMLEVWRK
jgi:hypothetical protein